jgi:hypothetical protein
MTDLRQLGTAAALLILIAPAALVGQESHLDAIPVMTEYFELILGGSYDIAGDMWTPEALERSGRFGIRFTGIPIKADCNSPIMRNLDDFSAKQIAPIRKYEDLDDNTWYKLQYADIFGNALLHHNYYVQRRGDWFWISYPQDFYAADWPVIETRYLRIRTHPESQKYLNPVVLAETDRFVENLASRLGLSANRLAEIAESKIEYFFCPSDSVVEQLSGFLVRGMLDLGSNDIISADFPHFHEMTHLLVNIRLREMPLYTLPIMREGLAVYLAGRWGKHPAPLMDLAVFLYREELVTFDSILTMGRFDSESGADIVYPVAGIFSGYLIERLGMARYLDLYLALSGTFSHVNDLSSEDVQARIVSATGHASWAELKSDFEAYLDRHMEQHAAALPGAGSGGAVLINDDRFVVSDDGDWLAFEFLPGSRDTVSQGNLLFAPVDGLSGQTSYLFESQYGQDQTYEGYRFGVRYDQNEAGLYDYATNQLVAKYIWGITPSDDYFDAGQKKISIRFRKALTDGLLPEKGKTRLLPL